MAYEISAPVGNWARKSDGRRDLSPFWMMVVPSVTPNVLMRENQNYWRKVPKLAGHSLSECAHVRHERERMRVVLDAQRCEDGEVGRDVEDTEARGTDNLETLAHGRARVFREHADCAPADHSERPADVVLDDVVSSSFDTLARDDSEGS